LTSLSAQPLEAGSRLRPESEEKDVGWITSAARSPRLDKEIALGYVKRGFNEIGSRLRTDANVLVEIVPLPFV
jgi:glycine cleavage system aminomethyltransferase T